MRWLRHLRTFSTANLRPWTVSFNMPRPNKRLKYVRRMVAVRLGTGVTTATPAPASENDEWLEDSANVDYAVIRATYTIRWSTRAKPRARN